jgi:hypothetical protein
MKTHKLDVEGTYFNTLEAIYEKLTTDIILNYKKVRAFSLRSGTG